MTQTIVLQPLRAAHATALYPLLADPPLGRGYATRAVRAMLVELKRHHAVSCFTASVDERNAASLRLLARLNFVSIDATDRSSLRFERAADDA